MIDIINLSRLSIAFGVILFTISLIVRQIRQFLHRRALIDQIPGPTRFSSLFGNVPAEILKYIGSEFDESKDLYYSKFSVKKWSLSVCLQPDSLRLKIGLLQALRGYTQVYAKERIFRIWLAWEPWVVLWKPETCETILSNNFILEKSTQYDFLHPWLGTGLLTSSGSKWRTRRKMLVPAFHFKILHDFVPVFSEQAAVMIDRLRDSARRGWPIDMVPVITACALDIICETIMGVSINAQKNPNNDYCKAVNK